MVLPSRHWDDKPAPSSRTSACASDSNANAEQVVVATLPNAVGGIAISATHVYWTEAIAGGSIMRVRKSGGRPENVVDGQVFPQKVIADTTHVYWSIGPGISPPVSRRLLDESPRLFGAAAVVETIDSGGAVAFAQDSDNVYWIPDTIGGIRRMSRLNGGPFDLAPNTPASPVDGLAIVGGRVYRTMRDAGKIVSVPVDGGVVETLVAGLQAPTGIAADATHVYWIDQKAETLSAIPRNSEGGGVVTTLANTGGLPWTLTIDCGSLYWTNISPCMRDAQTCAGSANWPSVQKVSIGGGPVTTLVREQNPVGLVIDESSIYWINRDDGRLGDAGTKPITLMRRSK